MTYRLSIHKLDQSCLFDLAWGQSQRQPASLPYPEQLTTLYQGWRRAYIGYYSRALRGRAGAVGQIKAVQGDLHSQLVQAEAKLLSEFHKWLKHEALFDLRAALAKAHEKSASPAELFISCTATELARLPWETWEVSQSNRIEIVRSPAMIRSEVPNRRQFRRGKTRVLAILGDETGLNFQGDREALGRLSSLLEVVYVGWQPGEDLTALRQRICDAIAQPRGWDILFFAGHSNEASVVDGQILIAPNTALSMRELAPFLRKAQQCGLQFALFNSCSGLDIANSLVDLGLSQVAIMREPIHNQVAHSFLLQFLQRLARFENTQEALLGTCRWLKLEQSLTYPSAALVPSLFRHPQSTPYRVQPTGWKARLRQWRPTRREAIAVGAIAAISLFPPAQNWLLDQRIRAQAIYRNVTGQLQASATPPLLLVQIDEETFRARAITQPLPVNQQLLADITTQLSQLNARVVAIDYLLDRPNPQNAVFRQALENAIAQQATWFIFATSRNSQGEWLGVHPNIASPTWTLEGDLLVPLWRMRPRRLFSSRLPLSYQVAIAHYLTQQPGNPPAPQLTGQGRVQKLVDAYLDHGNRRLEAVPASADLSPITALSYHLNQRWLQPLLDFSLPPEQIYSQVSASELLQSPEAMMQRLGLASLADTVVMVAPGGYDEAGLAGQGEDNFPLPPALAYWQQANGDRSIRSSLTGGEAHAYMIHHLTNRRMVVPIPDLWLVLLAAIAGKGLSLHLSTRPPKQARRLSAGAIGATLGYSWLSLQLYLSGAVLLPWLLPTLTIWVYVLPFLGKESHET